LPLVTMNVRSNLLALPLLTVLACAAGCASESSSSTMGSADREPAAGRAAPSESAGQSNGNAERAIAEADIVQLHGGRLYALSKSGTLSIVDVSRTGRLTMLGQAYFPGEPFEMYLRGDLLVAMTNGAYAVSGQVNEPARPTSPQNGGALAPAPAIARDPSSGAGVIVINVADPGLMQRVATFAVPGEIADSRIVGDVLYLATYENSSCYGCAAQPRTTVTSFDLATPSQIRQVDQLAFAAGMTPGWDTTAWKRSIFVNADRIYVGGHDDLAPYAGVVDEGVIDVVDIGDPTGRLKKGAHLTTTGAILSRWQMDEHEGTLRVVSQRGSGYARNGVGEPEVQTFHVWNTGAIQPVAKTSIHLPRQEALKTVRFAGDRAYAITFAETDPLFVIDLAQEAAPRQRGELEMPGWVFHLEPRGDRLLGLGLDRRDASGHLNVSLFDVANMDAPRLIQRVSFGPQSTTTDDAILDGELPEDQDRIQKAFRVLDGGLVVVPYSGSIAGSAGYGSCASGGAVQLIAWEQDSLTKQAALPVAGNPRRALLNNQTELLAVSDSNVTAFDIGRRDVALKTADLVIGSCEPRIATGSGWMPDGDMRRSGGGEMTDDYRIGFCSSSGAGAPVRGALGTAALFGLAVLAGAARRRRVA
jgi:hypothetical protein